MKYLSSLLLAIVTVAFFTFIFHLHGNEIQPLFLLSSFAFGVAIMPITIRLPVFRNHYIKDKMLLSDQRNSIQNQRVAPVACGLFGAALTAMFFYLLNRHDFLPYVFSAGISSASISFYYEP